MDMFADWQRQSPAAAHIGVYYADLPKVAAKYKIDMQIVAGMRLYYKPDCERARKEIADMRAEREARKAAA